MQWIGKKSFLTKTKKGLKAYNFSRGGMTAKEYVESFAEANGMWDKDKACQAYVIALGVNDIYNQNTEIGSLSDIDAQNCANNKPTFVGYYARIIDSYIDYIVRHNPEDFKTIGFVGTDIKYK